MPRSRLIMFVVGASESGKTVLVRKIAKLANQPMLVIDPAGSWGDLGICVRDPWAPIARALKSGFNGTLILDDADAYLSSSGSRDTWGQIWTMHRHFGMDLIAMFRRPQEIPKVAFTSCSRLFAFQYMPGTPEYNYLRKRGYVPESIPFPSKRFEYIECDIKAQRYAKRKITARDLQLYGNPRGF
ncbi:MAG: hypothetical protein LBM75_07245 [Myxococcales bacterium]|nr:hypothetical protein [Myxococcales bacterium]